MQRDRVSAIISPENSGAFIAPIKMFIAEYREEKEGKRSLLQEKKTSYAVIDSPVIRIVEIIKLYLCAQQMHGQKCARARSRGCVRSKNKST